MQQRSSLDSGQSTATQPRFRAINSGKTMRLLVCTVVLGMVDASGLGVRWTNAVGVSHSVGSLAKTASGGAWDAGAASVRTINNGGGSAAQGVSFTSCSDRGMIGLSTADVSSRGTSTSTISHAFYCYNGQVYIVSSNEAGSLTLCCLTIACPCSCSYSCNSTKVTLSPVLTLGVRDRAQRSRSWPLEVWSFSTGNQLLAMML